MEIGVELISLGAAILGQWLHLWRRFSRVETRLQDVHVCLDDAQQKIGTQNERLARIEGRMEEREMRWEASREPK